MCILGRRRKYNPKKKNIPILNFCPRIDDIFYDEFLYHVRKKEFDFAVNFDEELVACDLLYNINSKQKFGYTNLQYKYHPVNLHSEYAYQLSKDDNLKFKENKKTYQQIIFEMCGIKWDGEKYGFKYPSTPRGSYVALNTEVGNKWPTKQWTYWNELKLKLDKECIPWQSQKTYNTLEEYFNWIAEARTIVTSDSLGMHLSIALNKPCVAIFGPTSQVEIESYGMIDKVYFKNLQCSPCYKKKCPYNLECMNGLSSQLVFEKVLEQWKR